MSRAGRLVGEVLTELSAKVAPGVSTAELDELAERRILAAGATPAFKGYHGYPATTNTPTNDEDTQDNPSQRRPTQEGDTDTIDEDAQHDGYFVHSATTLPDRHGQH